MLSIRQEQLAVLKEGVESSLVRDTARHIRESCADEVQGLDEPALHSRVRCGIARARANRFTWESSITGFVYLMFRVSPGFDAHPAMRAALDDPSIQDENYRLNSLFDRATGSQWEEASLNAVSWADLQAEKA